MQNCSKCGQAFDGSRCIECVARLADIEKTFVTSLWVATGGVCGSMLAEGFYPALGENWLLIYSLLVLILIPVPIGFTFVHWRRVTRYSRHFRFLILFMAGAFSTPFIRPLSGSGRDYFRFPRDKTSTPARIASGLSVRCLSYPLAAFAIRKSSG